MVYGPPGIGKKSYLFLVTKKLKDSLNHVEIKWFSWQKIQNQWESILDNLLFTQSFFSEQKNEQKIRSFLLFFYD